MRAASRLRLLVACLVLSCAGSGGLAAAPASACATRPIYSVARFYQNISVRDFRRAWSCLSGPTKRGLGGFGRWRRGFRTSDFTELLAVSVRREQAGVANLSVRLRACERSGRGVTIQTFAGSWEAFRTGRRWLLREPDIEPVGEVRRSRC